MAITYTRKTAYTTGENRDHALEELASENISEVIFFASDVSSVPDENEANLPLMYMLAKGFEPGQGHIFSVYDGLFLTAARRPRYLEIKDLLDVACDSGKAYFSPLRAPYTATLKPQDAARTLLNLKQSFKPLNPQTREEYFSMLSTIPEAQYP